MKNKTSITVLAISMLLFLILPTTGHAKKDGEEIIILKIGEDLESINSNSARIGNQYKIGILTKDTKMKDCYAMVFNSKGYSFYAEYSKDYEEDLIKDFLVDVIEENEETFTITYPRNDYPENIGKVERSSVSYDIRLFAKSDEVLLENVDVYDEAYEKIVYENFTGRVSRGEKKDDGYTEVFIYADGPYKINSMYIDYDYNKTGEIPKVYKNREEAKSIFFPTPFKDYNYKIALITENTEVKDLYTFDDVYKDGEYTNMAFYVENGKDGEYISKDIKGSLVYVLEEGKETSRVKFYDNIPQVLGTISNDAISYDPQLFKKANCVFLNNIDVYDKINGKIVDDMIGIEYIVEKKDGWLKFSGDGGADDFWAKESDIYYNYNEILKEENRTSLDVKY